MIYLLLPYCYIIFYFLEVHRNPRMKNTTNLLILNLAVADLLFLLVRKGVVYN